MAPKRRGKEPAVVAAPSTNLDPLNTVEVIPCSQDDLGEIVKEKRRLISYRDEVPGSRISSSPFFYASVHDNLSGWGPTGQCVVMRRKPLQDAYDIINFLNSCQHPNILKPYGIWVDDYKRDLAYVTFPLLDGTLSKLDAEYLFLVEIVNNITHLEGFTEHGFRAFRQIMSAVQHVNVRYNDALAGTSSGGSRKPPSALLPLKLGVDRIFYEKIPTGEYNVLLGDFYTSNGDDWPAGLTKKPTVQDIWRANWNGVGQCLKTLIGKGVPSAELKHLIDVLTNPSIRFDDLLWEPALWDAKMKLQFCGEIIWCVNSDNTGERRKTLSNESSLGLKPCIQKLGLHYTEDNLLGSVTFLRNKILAHADDPYLHYPGPKENIGLDKATIEKFVAKEKPDYMIKLIKVIRQLKWIKESPLGKTSYIQQFKTT